MRKTVYRTIGACLAYLNREGYGVTIHAEVEGKSVCVARSTDCSRIFSAENDDVVLAVRECRQQVEDYVAEGTGR